MQLRRPSLAPLALGLFGLVACGGSGGDSTAPETVTAAVTEVSAEQTPTSAAPVVSSGDTLELTTPDTTTLDAEAPDLGRVVALAEEFLLADVLSLGIEPIASSATVDDVGFQGLDEFDTSDIEVLPMTTLSLEYLASLEPDTIITTQFWVDQVGAGVLEGMADVIIVPDGLNGPERLTAMGELLDRPEHAAAMVADYDTALQDARAAVSDDCTMSLAAVYPGPSVAAFVAGPWEIPSSILAAGCRLDPDAEAAAPDQNGRAWLSLEQLGLLDSELLVLMQSDTVEGESDALEEIQANGVWKSLPAVQADNVVVLDRLGYPGAAGQIRLLEQLGTLTQDAEE